MTEDQCFCTPPMTRKVRSTSDLQPPLLPLARAHVDAPSVEDPKMKDEQQPLKSTATIHSTPQVQSLYSVLEQVEELTKDMCLRDLPSTGGVTGSNGLLPRIRPLQKRERSQSMNQAESELRRRPPPLPTSPDLDGGAPRALVIAAEASEPCPESTPNRSLPPPPMMPTFSPVSTSVDRVLPMRTYHDVF